MWPCHKHVGVKAGIDSSTHSERDIIANGWMDGWIFFHWDKVHEEFGAAESQLPDTQGV